MYRKFSFGRSQLPLATEEGKGGEKWMKEFSNRNLN
jgi:hypothetical protein